jgi:hypothetical protein
LSDQDPKSASRAAVAKALVGLGNVLGNVLVFHAVHFSNREDALEEAFKIARNAASMPGIMAGTDAELAEANRLLSQVLGQVEDAARENLKKQDEGNERTTH